MRPLYSFSGQKVLVTGASGFLGSHLSRRLGEKGAEVYAVSRGLRTNNTGNIRWSQGDMADVDTVRDLLRKVRPDVIFHLSGLSTAIPDLDLVLPTFHSLLTSTVNILTVAAGTGCRRIVLIGSLTEPGASHATPTPGSPYAAAKWASSTYGRMFNKLYGTPVVNIRTFMTYGPGQDAHKLIPYVTLSLLRGEVPKLSTGQWQADWIFVDDVIDGFLAAAHAPKVEGCTLDLGSGVLVPVREIVQQLIKLVGSEIEPKFGALPDRPLEEVRAADTTQAFAMMGWKATTTLERGLERAVDWYKKQARNSFSAGSSLH